MNPFNSLNKRHLSFLTSLSLFLFLLITIPVTLGLLNNPKEITRPRAKEIGGAVPDEAMLAQAGFHLLKDDEFALVRKKIGNPSGKTYNRSFTLQNGQIYTYQTDTSEAVTLLEGSIKYPYIIKEDSNITVHSLSEINQSAGNSDKIENAVYPKFTSRDSLVPVIIQVKLPFNRFYEKGDGPDRINDKKSKFLEAKNKLSGHFKNKAKIKNDLEIINGFSADIDSQTLSELAKDPDITKVELDKTVKITLDTSVDEINARSVWPLSDANKNTLTGMGKTIAVIDTGVDYTHPDLGGCLGPNCKVIGGYNCISLNNNPMDDHGHGTHVAATAAGKGTAANGQQLWGVAPDAKILAYKVLNSSGSGTWDQVLCGMQKAIDPNGDGNPADHADVATMSLGGSGNPDDAISLAADNGAAVGVVFTIAAGNSGGTSTIGSPGTSRTAITVAAACKASQIGINSYCSKPIASFSSRGPLIWNGVDLQKPDLAAPGVGICAAEWSAYSSGSRCFDDKHIAISGTSMATPHVAGAAALVLQAFPGYTPAQVKDALKSTARDLGSSLTYNDQGAGEINLSAAIPMSQLIMSTPSGWPITSDPTKKTNTFTQTFTISTKDSTITTVNLAPEQTINGVTLTFDKTTLNLTGGASDTFTATAVIDNDLAASGTFHNNIIFSQNGFNKGLVPVSLNIKPTATISENLIDYGIDLPSLASWTSAVKTLTVTNLRSDIPQTLTITAPVIKNGIVFNAPSSITASPSGTASFDTTFNVNNSLLPNGFYSGNLLLANSVNKIITNVKFTKYYLLKIQDINPSELISTGLTVHNDNTRYFQFGNSTDNTFYLESPGNWNVIANYGGYYNNVNYMEYLVFKENIPVSSEITTVNVTRSEAKNLITLKGTDINGSAIPALGNTTKLFLFKNTLYVSGSSIISFSDGYDNASYYISDFSTNYLNEFYGLYPTAQPKITNYVFSGSTLGLQSQNKSFTNTPGELKKITAVSHADEIATGITPFFMYDKVSVLWYPSITMPLPVYQTLYSNANPDKFSTKHYIDKYYYLTPSFTLNPLNNRYYYVSTDLPQLPPPTDGINYNGLGPSYWNGKFTVSPTYLRLDSYYPGAFYNSAPAFIRQDYSLKSYPATPLNIYQNNIPVNTASLPYVYGYPFGFLNRNTYITSFSLPAAGLYEARVDFPYKNSGIDLLGKVSAVFDSSKADPNPPAIKRLFYFANNQRSEVYDPAVPNRLELEFDPVGGSISAVTVEISSDGTNFQSLTPVLNGTSYITDIPSVSGLITKLTLRIKAVDDSQNSLTYTFELPVGTMPTPPPITPTIIPTATPTPSGDSTPPSVTINSPAPGTYVTKKGSMKVNVTATDASGINYIAIYLDSDSLPIKTCFKSPCSTSYPVSSLNPGLHTVKAYVLDNSPQRNNTTATSLFTVR